MKKLLIIFFLLIALPVYAADTKTTDLGVLSPDPTDMLYCVDDVSGLPTSKSCLVSALLVDSNIPNSITIDNATTSTALAANGGNCSAGSYPLGVDASGAVESCTDATTEIDSSILTHKNITAAHHTATTDTGPSPDCSGTTTYQDGEGGCDDLSSVYQPLDSDLTTIAGETATTGNVLIGVSSAWASVAQPIIDCTNCTSIPGGSTHTGTVTWGGTAILESGTAFQFGDGTDVFIVHSYANTGTDVGIVYSTGAMVVTGALSATNLSGTNTGDVTHALDLVTTAPVTGGQDNVMVGADGDVTIALTLLKDIVTTAPITGGEDNVLPGADADLTIAITVAKDIVSGNGLTGGEDNVLTGADADLTLNIELKDNAEDSVGNTSSVSGMEFESAELTLLQGCSDNQILKWDEAGDNWNCEADTGGGGASTFYWVWQPQAGKLPGTAPMGIDAGLDKWIGRFDDTVTDESFTAETVLYPYQGGTLAAKIIYVLETTSSSDIAAFDLLLDCTSDTDANANTFSFGTTNSIDSPSQSLTAGVQDVLTDLSLNEDSCAEFDSITGKLFRDVSADGVTDDIFIKKVIIYEL